MIISNYKLIKQTNKKHMFKPCAVSYRKPCTKDRSRSLADVTVFSFLLRTTMLGTLLKLLSRLHAQINALRFQHNSNCHLYHPSFP